MDSIRIKAYAKINLALDVLRRMDNGYHELRMIMQQIDLCDIIEVKKTNKEIIINSNSNKMPLDDSNLAVKAFNIMKDKYYLDGGVEIDIEKNIPIAAGLAGGSTDAAAVIKATNKLYDLKLSNGEMRELALKIGADVPYCIEGGTCVAEGIGEILTKINDFKEVIVLIAKPDINVSTAYVYGNLNLSNKKERNFEEVLTSVEKKDIIKLSQTMYNDLESVTEEKHEVVKKIKQDMISNGAVGSMMSGSGPTVFGIFEDDKTAKECLKKIDEYVDFVKIVRTI